MCIVRVHCYPAASTQAPYTEYGRLQLRMYMATAAVDAAAGAAEASMSSASAASTSKDRRPLASAVGAFNSPDILRRRVYSLV